MVDRPIDFDETTPSGSSNPREGDNELRRIKLYTKNAFEDMTSSDRSASGRVTHPLHATTINASGEITAADGIDADSIVLPEDAIGSLAFAEYTGSDTSLAFNATVNGSDLSPASANGDSTGTLTGTWRCLGALTSTSGATATTLFVKLT